jgi:hypothetical protein
MTPFKVNLFKYMPPFQVKFHCVLFEILLLWTQFDSEEAIVNLRLNSLKELVESIKV